jgi:hypothetical protein
VAVAAQTATHGWPTHTTRLPRTLYRYLIGEYHTDALAVHGHAPHAAHHTGDPTGQSPRTDRPRHRPPPPRPARTAAEHLQQALHLFRQTGDPAGQARALTTLGAVEQRLGHYRPATDHHERALTLYQHAAPKPAGPA